MPGPVDPYPSDPAPNTLADANKLRPQLNALFTYLTGNVDRDAIKDGEVTSAELAAAAVTAAKFASLPAARAFQAGASAITNNVAPVALVLQSERFDTDTIHDNATNPSRLTCKTAGTYVIGASVQWQSVGVSTGMRKLALLLNGATTLAISQVPPVNSDVTVQTVHTITRLAVNDYVEATVAQISGGNLNVEFNAQASPEFWMAWVGP